MLSKLIVLIKSHLTGSCHIKLNFMVICGMVQLSDLLGSRPIGSQIVFIPFRLLDAYGSLVSNPVANYVDVPSNWCMSNESFPIFVDKHINVGPYCYTSLCQLQN